MFSPIQICWASNVLQLLLDGRGKSGDEGLTTLGPVPHRVRVNWLNTPERETKKGRVQKEMEVNIKLAVLSGRTE